MQAVILAAGRGARMKELTTETPKSLLRLGEKTLLEKTLEKLPPEIDEIIIVIGFQGEKIKSHIGESFRGKNIRYVEQKEMGGTGHALWQAREFLHDRFLVLMGDDFYSEDAIKTIVSTELAMMIHPEPWKAKRANVISDDFGNLLDIAIEGQNPGEDIMVNTGLYILSEKIFKIPLVKYGEEYSLPHTLVSLSKTTPVAVIKTDFWLQINTPEDLEKARESV